ncbi:MAG: hypothetical protein NDI61_00945 [Bdellovibrionaceae bacterium]|nr:hypothetical protein [Pseudobdellovibrionaceae bacterium]
MAARVLKILNRFLRTIVLLTIGMACVSTAQGARDYGVHSGYLESVRGERDVIVEDLVLLTPPPSGPSLHQRIFNEKLTKEFTERYEQKFGRTEQQRVYLAPNNNTYYTDLFGFQGTPQQTDNERRRFGEFMLRRLTEYHVENYAKTDPKARVVWEAKEKLSNVKVAVGKSVKVSAKYSISGNSADINFANPWLGAKVTLYMGDDFTREAIVSLSKGLTPTVSAETHWAMDDGIVSLIGRKAMTPVLQTSFTMSTYTHHGGVSRRESLYLTGASYSY